MMGSLNILNVGAGDVRLEFDKSNPQDLIRGKRIVKDMLRRGYALLIEVERDGEKRFERAKDFDEEHGVYLIADFDPVEAQETDRREVSVKLRERSEVLSGKASATEEKPAESAPAESPELRGKGKRGKYRKVPMESARAVGVGRSAGG